MSALSLEEELAEAGHEAAKSWWLFLVAGVVWTIFGFVMLSGSFATVRAVALFFGVAFLLGGLVEFTIAVAAPSWRWVHVVFGIISVAAGITALAWPGRTFIVMAAIVGWYLIFDGMFGTIMSISSRRINDLWWLGLIVYLMEMALGVWATGYVGRSVALLVIWIATGAIARGLTDIWLGLSIHGADRQVSRYLNS